MRAGRQFLVRVWDVEMNVTSPGSLCGNSITSTGSEAYRLHLTMLPPCQELLNALYISCLQPYLRLQCMSFVYRI